MDAVGKIFSVIVVVFAIFFVPIILMSTTKDEVTQSVVYNITADFVDNVRAQGYVSQDQYLEFVSALDNTGELYDINMTHSHEIVTPVYENGEVVGTKTSEDCYYSDDILAQVYETNGAYFMNQGDTFSVEVSLKNKTLAQTMRQSVLGYVEESSPIYVVYGGVIRDENF